MVSYNKLNIMRMVPGSSATAPEITYYHAELPFEKLKIGGRRILKCSFRLSNSQIRIFYTPTTPFAQKRLRRPRCGHRRPPTGYRVISILCLCHHHLLRFTLPISPSISFVVSFPCCHWLYAFACGLGGPLTLSLHHLHAFLSLASRFYSV